MALTAALKAQIGAWYKALQQQIPDFIPRAPQRQMIADVAKTLAGSGRRKCGMQRQISCNRRCKWKQQCI